jgi:hypothetical protein
MGAKAALVCLLVAGAESFIITDLKELEDLIKISKLINAPQRSHLFDNTHLRIRAKILLTVLLITRYRYLNEYSGNVEPE